MKFNDNQTKDEDILDAGPTQDNEKEENNKAVGKDSQMSVTRFHSFILKICGLDRTNFSAIYRIVAMDTSSEESIIRAAQDYCQDSG